MQENQWRFIEELSDRSVIAKYWQSIKIEAPPELEELIAHYNGGAPDLAIFDTPEAKECSLGYLLSYQIDSEESVYDAYEALASEHHRPQLLPIFSTDFGDYVCYDNRSHSIVYWLHEENRSLPLASTLPDFLQTLYQLDD
jgi:SMI1-KNR4 cell-wall